MTFLLRDMLLAAGAGFFIAVLLGALRKTSAHKKPIARLLSLVLEPIVYWADLRGADGRPSHSKIAYFIGLVVALYGLLAFGRQQLTGLDFGFIAYTMIVLSYALGKQIFNTALKLIVARFPGAEKSFARLSNGEMKVPPEAAVPDSGYESTDSEIPPGGGKAIE